MFDYHRSPYWKEYVASLENEMDAGLGGFCEWLCTELQATQQSLYSDEPEWGIIGKCGLCGKTYAKCTCFSR
jgi:hypothetical protein